MRSPRQAPVLVGLLALGYFATAKLSYLLTFRPSGVAVIWVPAGLVLAVLLLSERRTWGWILAGAYLGNVAADLSAGSSLGISLAAGVANGVEALAAAWLLVRVLGAPVTLHAVRSVLGLILGAAILSNAVTAVLGAAVLMAGSGMGFIRAWYVWWIGDGIGMLIIAPVLLTLAAAIRSRRAIPAGRVAEAVGLVLLLALVSTYALGPLPASAAILFPSPYMTFPLLLWAGLRFGPAGAALATLLVCGMSAWFESQGVGPFAQPGQAVDAQVVQASTYFGLASLSSLVPAAALAEHRAAERRHTASEWRYRQLFENNPYPMWIYDPRTLRILAVNDTAVERYGYRREEFLAMTIVDLRPPEEVPELLASLAEMGTAPAPVRTWKHRRKDGSTMDVDIAAHGLTWEGRPARAVAAIDVTERELLQRQLLQAQKMEAVGQLAGGIAHDFNNLLAVIIGFADLALVEEPEAEARHAYLQEIRKAGDRAAGLTRQLLAFSRKQIIEPRVFDPNTIISNLGKILQRTLGETIALELRLFPDLGRVKADPGQIEQVIMNLAVNARDAMPAGGRLVIETANVLLDDAYTREHLGAVPGPHVLLSMSDSGAGMPPETLAHIFEPFYTTKEQGTGLGLSTVYGIIKQAGGSVWVYSEPGQGTTFKVYLPRVADAPDPHLGPERTPVLDGTETVLVVEDADGVRQMVQRALAARGYRVLTAATAAEGRRAAEAHRGVLHLVITDVVLPDGAGPDLARQVATWHRGVRVLCMSGYTDDAVLQHGVVRREIAFLQKPFSVQDLWQKVRQVLDAAPER